jgi:hypothetical protein
MPKAEPKVHKELDPVYMLQTYMDQLRDANADNKFLFLAFKAIMGGKGVCNSLPENRPMSCNTARPGLEATKLAQNNEKFGLHSCRVGALTMAANTGKLTNMQLQKLGR